MLQRDTGWSWKDVALALLIFAGTVAYLASLPRDLGAADEALHLYDAKRVLEGEVIYRDFFTAITPGFMYLMAAVFWLFGTDLATARLAAAVMHGLTAVAIYGSCRALGVQRLLSAATVLVYLVLAPLAWPIASQHWLSTVLCALLLWACVAWQGDSPRWTLLPGVLLGLLLAVQQQRGLPMAVGITGWLAVDHLVRRRWVPAWRWSWMAREIAWLAAGTLAVMLPTAVALLAWAGVAPAWDALVRFPLYNYGAVTHCLWGDVNVMTLRHASYTFPRLLAALPGVLVVTAARAAVLIVTRRRAEEAHALVLLLCFCGASALSIAYFPDFIHIAFIAPAFLVAWGETAAWAARLVPAGRPGYRRAAATVGMLALLGVAGLRLHYTRARLHQAYPVPHQTRFGRIDFANADDVRLYETVDRLMDTVPDRALFCYPGVAHLYLMAGAVNPTPYGFLVANFFGPERTQRALDVLRTRRLPYVVLWDLPGDPIAAFIKEHYEPMDPGDPVGRVIHRRKQGEDVRGENLGSAPARQVRPASYRSRLWARVRGW
jgi:hypothetical protein